MKDKSNFNIHFIMMSAMFLLGNAVISVPYKNAEKNNFLSFIIAFVSGLLIICLLTFVFDFLYDEKRLLKNTVIIKIVYIVSSILLIYVSVLCFRDYSDFVAFRMLPNTPRFIVSVIFALCVLWFSLQKDKIILKFSLFSLVITAIIIILFFIISIPRYRLENIIILEFPDIKDTVKQAVSYFVNVFVTSLPVLLYRKCFFEKMEKKYICLAVVSGTVLLAVCLLNSLLLFGTTVASEMEFPYSDAISTVTVGELFTRMDGFSYFVFFASSIIKITVCISVIKSLVSRLGVKNKKAIAAVCSGLVFIGDCLLK